MTSPTTIALLAAYNRGANERLFTTCSELSGDELRRDAGLYFRSVLGTLNHILVADRIWLDRFEGSTRSSSGLGTWLHSTFDALRTAREAEDERIVRVMTALDETDLGRTIAYVNNEGVPKVDPLSVLVLHFFNHQTHHRGQVHAALTSSGRAPVLDLHRVLETRPAPGQDHGEGR